MPNLSRQAIIPSIVSSILIGGVIMLFVFNGDVWPIFIPASLLIGVIGIYLGSRKSTVDPLIQKLRWQVSAYTLLVSIIIYAVAGYIAGSREDSGLTAIALIVLGPILFPMYFGLAQLLAIVLVPNRPKQ